MLEGPLAGLPEITPETLEAIIPEEVVLVGSQYPDRIASVTSTTENLRRIRLVAWGLPGAVALLVGLLLLVVRTRLAWLGAVLLLIAAPAAGIASAAPSLGQRAVSMVIPGQPAETYRVLTVFLEQVMSPALVVSLGLAGLGAGLLLAAAWRRRGDRGLSAAELAPVPAP